jgi:hypothetical protein
MFLKISQLENLTLVPSKHGIKIDNNQNVIYNFNVGSGTNIAHKQLKVYSFIKARYLRKTYNLKKPQPLRVK